MDGSVIIAIVFAIAVLLLLISLIQKKQRRKYLLEKYGSEDIVKRIMAKEVWQGMTVGQLIDSWGPPEDRDQTVYKTKTKETLKYGRTGKNRFRQRVYIENDYVVGWQNQ